MQPRSLLQYFLLCTIGVLLFGSTYAPGQAGTLDTTFASNGIFLAPTGKSLANAVAIQSDGKIVVAGTGIFGNPAAFGSMLFRLNTNGTLDTTFGSGGVANVAGYGFFGVAIQINGEIVAASQGQGNFQVARFESNGTLDTLFGSGGLTAPIAVGGPLGGQGTPNSGSLALQSDGKILVVEGSGNPSLMVRYTTGGQLDPSFGVRGMMNLGYPSPTQVAVQSNGAILVTSGASGILGFGLPVPAEQTGAISRYTLNGFPDRTFGAGGTAASVVSASALLLQSDGKIVVAGAINSKLNVPLTASDVGFGIVRYNSNGTVDATFGKGGVVSTDFGATATDSGAFALAIQSNDDIVAAGAAGIVKAGTFTSAFGLSRYTSTGVGHRAGHPD
jgi:uncharacterized delta-60 repeat protein